MTENRCIVELALSSGARANEICQFDISDIDFQNLEAKIRHGKGDKSRTVYITEICAVYLKKYLANSKDNEPFLFINRNNNRLRPKNISDSMIAIEKRSGVNNVHCHRFRKTLASILFKRGVDIHIIQQILGHANINTTVERYVKTDPTQIKYNYAKGM